MGRKPGRGTGAEVTSYEASCPPQASARPRGTAARRVQPCQHPAPGRGISQFPLSAGVPPPAASLLPASRRDRGGGPSAAHRQCPSRPRVPARTGAARQACQGTLRPQLCPHHKPDLPPLFLRPSAFAAITSHITSSGRGLVSGPILPSVPDSHGGLQSYQCMQAATSRATTQTCGQMPPPVPPKCPVLPQHPSGRQGGQQG